MTGNGDMQFEDSKLRDIPTAIADAITEHELWLDNWRRAALCGRPPAKAVTDEDAHRHCRFGQWFLHNSERGMLDESLFTELDRLHRETHEAARYLAGKLSAGRFVPIDEYDALMDVADKFRKVAVRIQELHGRPENGEVPSDDEMAELQSRLNMLSELERERERALRTNTPMCLAMIRPNGLAGIRQEYGLVAIDKVVLTLAARLFAHLRPYDSVFRYGRAEFVVCVPGADGGQAETVCRRLDEILSERPVALSEENESAVTARFGVALADSRISVQELLDRAMRAANMAGTAEGERVVVWTAELEN